jgi:hypothetical protein
MSKFYRSCAVLCLWAFVVVATSSQTVLAQRINFGGAGQNNQRDNDQDDDRDDNDNDLDNNQSNNRGSSRSGSSNSQKIQQFFRNSQGGKQGGQGSNNQDRSRRSDRDERFPGGQIQPFPGQNYSGGQNNLKHGNWQGGKWQGSRKIDNWVQTFGGDKKPFSAQWYHDHPKAWKYDNQKSNVWVVGTVPGVYQWLGWGNVPQQYIGHDHAHHFDPSHYGQWYPLGVYSLMAGPGDMGTRIVQLAVDRHGHIAGNYYDMISNSNYSISGDVRRQSQRVYFTLNKNKQIGFRSHISQLLQPYGTVTVQLPGGEQHWQFVRLEN